MGGQREFSNIHRKDKIHTIQPEKLPNRKLINNQHMEKRRADRASETTPHPSIDLQFKNDLERAHPIRQNQSREKKKSNQMPESHQMGSRSTKSHQNTSNDSPQHTQIRRGNIRLSITGNPQKTLAHTQQRVKVSPWTIRNLSNGKYSVRGQSTYPGRNVVIEQRENDYPNHHKPKTLLRRPDENEQICVQTGNTQIPLCKGVGNVRRITDGPKKDRKNISDHRG
jgi:hypothetical protein